MERSWCKSVMRNFGLFLWERDFFFSITQKRKGWDTMFGHKRKGVLVMALILVLLLAGCSSNEPEPQGGAEKIIIRQTGTDDREFTVEQLKAYAPVERNVESISSSGEVTPYSVKGALFADVLADMGLIQTDLAGIRLVAGDGYAIEVGPEVLASREIILAYEVDGEPLFADSRPIRIIIPDERAMYWVRNLTEIEILPGRAAVAVSEIQIIETVVGGLAQEEYLSDNEVQQSVSTTDLVLWEGDDFPVVHIYSVDGLAKNETWENFAKGRIMWTGSDAPAFVGEDLPKGMHVKKILWFAADHKAFLSAVHAQEKYSALTVEGNTGVALTDIFTDSGFQETANILLTAADGYTVTVAREDIGKGIIYVNTEGQACVVFAGLPRNTMVKAVTKIEAVE